jgi:hypothetical protein
LLPPFGIFAKYSRFVIILVIQTIQLVIFETLV